MRSAYSVLKLGYMPVSIAGGVRKAVGGFLRYLQFREQPLEHEAQGGLDAHLRYIAHRDRTSPAGRVFGREGALTGGDERLFCERTNAECGAELGAVGEGHLLGGVMGSEAVLRTPAPA